MYQIFETSVKTSVMGLLAAATIGSAGAETINWNNAVLDTLVDSYGNSLDDAFYFQLGFFENSFIPDESNVSEWSNNWKVFDQAEFNPALGYFTSTSQIKANGTSTSPYAELGINFSGQDAYIWTFNSKAIESTSEWFLATNPAWVFPTTADDCCDNTLPVQWSVSDLDEGNDVPVWGRQGDKEGAGVYTVTSNGYNLQTYTLIPEPSVMFLASLAGTFVLLRRRRVS